MPHDADRSKTTVRELAAQFRSELIPLTSKFSYFCVLPIADEDLRHYLGDPIAAIGPAVIALLPPVGILLAAYLERGGAERGRRSRIRAPCGRTPDFYLTSGH